MGTGKSNRGIKMIQERSRLFGHLEALEVVSASVNSTIFDLTSETGEKASKDEILPTPRLSGPELNRNRSYKEGKGRESAVARCFHAAYYKCCTTWFRCMKIHSI